MQFPREIGPSLVVVGLAGALGALGCSRSMTESVASSESDLISVGFPRNETPTLTTVFKAPLVVEGLAADRDGNLYTSGRQGNPCPVWREPEAGGPVVVVGNLPPPCSPNGLAFDAAGDLFVADGSTETNGTTGDRIYRLTPNAATPPTATLFVSGVPGANGIAFDRKGNLWAADGTTGQGRVWSITPDGTVTEVFRVQPMSNLVSTIATTPDGGASTLTGGVGRDVRALPPGTLTITDSTRVAANTAGTVPIVANGLAFDPEGDLFIADTARGAVWKAEFDHEGNLRSSVGCDTTFTPDTLCLKNIFVQHALLEGLDGIVLDERGNIWGAANERNAMVFVTREGSVQEFIRNPPDVTTRLRNGGPLEFPTSPFLDGKKLCITQSDTTRRDNFPNTAGEVGPPGPDLAKISCLDQAVFTAGLPLPVH
jgi:sugar lactone lactonase YvrE